VTPDEAIAQAKKGRLAPVYLVMGEEQTMRDQVVDALRRAALGAGVPAFNEDKFTAGEVDAATVISAARTVPMMANRRFVLVRGAERWDGADASSPFDAIAEYAAAPVDSTCLVIVAAKIDGRRKLVQTARKLGFFVACEPLDARALPGWIAQRCAAKGHPIDRDVAELLAALTGPDLASVDDALERLSLYVGLHRPIDASAVGACIARVRAEDTWALVDAVGARDLGRALQTLADAYDPRERGLPLLGALAWSVRQLARYQAALASGASANDAARRAGVLQSHRARELSVRSRSVRPKEVERWILVLAETDLALKSSRRPADAILEEMLTRLCRADTRAARSASNATGGGPSRTDRFDGAARRP
jgi:DNA polymerase III subunit delta